MSDQDQSRRLRGARRPSRIMSLAQLLCGMAILGLVYWGASNNYALLTDDVAPFNQFLQSFINSFRMTQDVGMDIPALFRDLSSLSNTRCIYSDVYLSMSIYSDSSCS